MSRGPARATSSVTAFSSSFMDDALMSFMAHPLQNGLTIPVQLGFSDNTIILPKFTLTRSTYMSPAGSMWTTPGEGWRSSRRNLFYYVAVDIRQRRKGRSGTVSVNNLQIQNENATRLRIKPIFHYWSQLWWINDDSDLKPY